MPSSLHQTSLANLIELFHLLIRRYLMVHVKCSPVSAWKIQFGIWVGHLNGPFFKSSHAQVKLKLQIDWCIIWWRCKQTCTVPVLPYKWELVVGNIFWPVISWYYWQKIRAPKSSFHTLKLGNVQLDKNKVKGEKHKSYLTW